jgi:hypothetical protein
MNDLTLISCLAMAMFSVAARPENCTPAANADARPEFDASLLKEGRFTYRTTSKGEFVGETVLEIRRAGDNWRITMNAPKIAQSWQAVVDRSFAPRSAHLAMRTRTGPYEMSLQYAGNEVTGEERRADGLKPVRATLSGVVLDQRVDWAAMMALKTAPKAAASWAMFVFDPSTGASQMLGEGGGDAKTLQLRYRICKRDHVESYTVHANRDTPRYMLREDMPNGLVSELVKIEP